MVSFSYSYVMMVDVVDHETLRKDFRTYASIGLVG